MMEPMAIIFNGDVPLRALHAGLYIGFTAHFLGSQPYGALNDAPGLDNADDTCHGYTTDTDALGIVFENIFRSHSAYGCCDFGVPLFSTDLPKSWTYRG